MSFNARPRALSLSLLLCLAPLAQASGAPTECTPRDPTTAEVNSREGIRLAKAKQFRAAIALFRIAVELDQCAPDYRLLLARAFDRLDEFGEAEVQYKELMALFPGSPEAERATSYLEKLKVRAQAAASRPTSEPTKLDTPPPGPPWRQIGMGTAGAGVLFVALGAYFALDAQSADDDLTAAARGTDRGHYDDLVDQRDSSSTLSYVSYGLGLALVGGGAAMAFLLHEAPPPAQGEVKAVRVGPAADGLGLSLSGQF